MKNMDDTIKLLILQKEYHEHQAKSLEAWIRAIQMSKDVTELWMSPFNMYKDMFEVKETADNRFVE